MVLGQVSSPITIILITGLTATVSGTLSAAAIWSGSVAGTMSFGAGAQAGCSSNPIKLGGQLKVTDSLALSKSCTGANECMAALQASPNIVKPYFNFPLSYSIAPYQFQVTSTTGAIDLTLFLSPAILVEGSIPITPTATFQFAASLAPASRRLGAARELATCANPNPFFTAAVQGSLEVTAGPITIQGFVEGLIAAAGLTLPPTLTKAFPPTTIIPLVTMFPKAVLGASQAITSVCLTPSEKISGPAISGGGSCSSGGGGAAAAAAACGPGCVAGAIIGTLLGCALLFLAYIYYAFVFKKATPPAFLLPIVGCLSSTTLLQPIERCLGALGVARGGNPPVLTSTSPTDTTASAAAAAKMPAEPAAAKLPHGAKA